LFYSKQKENARRT